MKHLHYVGNNLIFRTIQALVNEYIEFVKESKLPMEKHYVLGVREEGQGTVYITDRESIGNHDIVKIEGFELYRDHCRPYLKSLVDKLVPNAESVNTITGHVFISKKDAISFPLHRDPATVLITMIKGEKDFIVDYEDNGDYEVFTVKEGEVLVIPENIPHMALNTHDSIMLSIGIEKSLYLQEQDIRALEARNAVY